MVQKRVASNLSTILSNGYLVNPAEIMPYLQKTPSFSIRTIEDVFSGKQEVSVEDKSAIMKALVPMSNDPHVRERQKNMAQTINFLFLRKIGNQVGMEADTGGWFGVNKGEKAREIK